MSVTKVIGSRAEDAWSMSEFVDAGGNSILAMAPSGQVAERVVAGAVGDQVLRREGIGQDVGATDGIWVIAVVGCSSIGRAG